MPIQGPQWTEFLSCEVCYKLFSEKANRPISLGCGHTVCKMCLSRLQQSKCPFDQSPITCDIDKLPVNYALLQLVGAAIPDKLIDKDDGIGDLSDARKAEYYESARKCIEELAVYLKPLSEESLQELEEAGEDVSDLKIGNKVSGGTQVQVQNSANKTTNIAVNNTGAGCMLSRPMQRKLVTLINCQLVEEEGRSRATRAARSLGERAVTELILAHQNPQQLSANLWAAVRTRGCQFLGPGMQEEVLRLILLALEEGRALSRKVLVLFVVQRLEKQYPQASKTAIGHVVQLLYRASCFRVTKREEESSLMQLKEEFRSYEALRREHDAQIVQIAMEAGLRISPEQWSSLLYGDSSHKSHMQSIIDKHQSPQSFAQGINELVLAVQRTGDPCSLLSLRPHLEFLAKIDPSPDCPAPSWEDLEAVMKSLKVVVQGLVDFLSHYSHRRMETVPQQNTRYKTSMCRDFTAKGSCPRGVSCTFAHSQDELEKYRSRSKKLSNRGFGSMSAYNSLTPKQKLELAQVQESSRQKMASGQGQSGRSADVTGGIAGDGEAACVGQLTNHIAGLAVASSVYAQPSAVAQAVQEHLQIGGPGFAIPIPTPSPMPGGAYAITRPRMSTSSSLSGPVTRLTFSGANLPEAICAEQICPTIHQYPQQVPLRLHGSEQTIPFANPQLVPRPVAGPSPPPMASGLGNPLGASQIHASQHAPPQIMLEAARVPDLTSMGVASAAACPLHHIAGELLQQPGPVYSGTPGLVPYPVEPYVVGPAGDLQGLAQASIPLMQTYGIYSAIPVNQPTSFTVVEVPVPEIQSDLDPRAQPFIQGTDETYITSLERLQNRKSEIISHLRGEAIGMVNGNGTTGPASLDRVLASGLRLGVGPLPHSVNNSFVATRATHSLEELDLGGTKYPQWSAGELINAKTENIKPLIKRAVSQPSHVPQSGKTQVLLTSPVKTKEDEFEESQPSGDPEEDCEVKETDFKGISTILDDEDDSFIPFDPPLVSKFGPISRARLKEMNSVPVQVTAEESTKCTPVLSVTPLDRPYPVSALVPSIYKPQMTASVTTPAMDNLPYSMYSVWGGQDLIRHKIPEMVQQLEKSAIAAPTTNQRLALQLQSIELQISMKTGKTPKPIHELLQEADTRDMHLMERSLHSVEARTGVKNVIPGNYYMSEWK